jgi:hypothetical protein
MPTLRTNLAALLVVVYTVLVLAAAILPAVLVGGLPGFGAGIALAAGLAQGSRRPFGVAVDWLIRRR